MTRMVYRMGIGLVVVLGLATGAARAAAPEVQIARDGTAAQPVIVSDKASERVRATADWKCLKVFPRYSTIG